MNESTSTDIPGFLADLDIKKMLLSRIEFELRKNNYKNAAQYIFFILREIGLDAKASNQLYSYCANLSGDHREILRKRLNIESEKRKIHISRYSSLLQALGLNLDGRDLGPSTAQKMKNRMKSLLGELNRLTSQAPLLLGVYSFEVQRGNRQERRGFSVDERIVISLESPVAGYVTVFHLDNEGNTALLYPHAKTDKIYVEANNEKRIGIKAEPPLGRHFLKAVWTAKPSIDVAAIDFCDQYSSILVLERIIESVKGSDATQWRQATAEFEVIDE